jgi:hypothetical protein
MRSAICPNSSVSGFELSVVSGKPPIEQRVAQTRSLRPQRSHAGMAVVLLCRGLDRLGLLNQEAGAIEQLIVGQHFWVRKRSKLSRRVVPSLAA